MMKKFLLFTLVLVAILPSAFLLMWGVFGWIVALASLLSFRFDFIVLLILITVPGGFIGIGGIFALLRLVMNEQPVTRMSRCLKHSLAYGTFSALTAGFMLSFWNWFLLGVFFAPLGITAYLLSLYCKKLSCLNGETETRPQI